MQKTPEVSPGIVILDSTKPEVTALREYMLSGPAVRKLGDPEVNQVFARIASRLGEHQGF